MSTDKTICKTTLTIAAGYPDEIPLTIECDLDEGHEGPHRNITKALLEQFETEKKAVYERVTIEWEMITEELKP